MFGCCSPVWLLWIWYTIIRITKVSENTHQLRNCLTNSKVLRSQNELLQKVGFGKLFWKTKSDSINLALDRFCLKFHEIVTKDFEATVKETLFMIIQGEILDGSLKLLQRLLHKISTHCQKPQVILLFCLYIFYDSQSARKSRIAFYEAKTLLPKELSNLHIGWLRLSKLTAAF